ncbi:MAG: sugar transporter [Bacteroidetes bacterium]|nr:sugar transporter [Bacteroidota bacterium]
MTTHILLFLSLFYCDFSFGQGHQWVKWQFRAEVVGKDEVVITAKAVMAPGWHIYSQLLNENGPIPTRLTFGTSEAFVLLGTPKEMGNAVRFYDDVYEMEITWYNGEVSFIQKIRLTRPVTTIKGTVEYMSCSEQTCVPGKQDFKIEFPLRKKS